MSKADFPAPGQQRLEAFRKWLIPGSVGHHEDLEQCQGRSHNHQSARRRLRENGLNQQQKHRVLFEEINEDNGIQRDWFGTGRLLARPWKWQSRRCAPPLGVSLNFLSSGTRAFQPARGALRPETRQAFQGTFARDEDEARAGARVFARSRSAPHGRAHGHLDLAFRRELADEVTAILQDDRKSVLFSTHITSDLTRSHAASPSSC